MRTRALLPRRPAPLGAGMEACNCLYLQLCFTLPGAPPHGVEIREFAVLLRPSLGSRVGRGEEKTTLAPGGTQLLRGRLPGNHDT